MKTQSFLKLSVFSALQFTPSQKHLPPDGPSGSYRQTDSPVGKPMILLDIMQIYSIQFWITMQEYSFFV